MSIISQKPITLSEAYAMLINKTWASLIMSMIALAVMLIFVIFFFMRFVPEYTLLNSETNLNYSIINESKKRIEVLELQMQRVNTENDTLRLEVKNIVEKFNADQQIVKQRRKAYDIKKQKIDLERAEIIKEYKEILREYKTKK